MFPPDINELQSDGSDGFEVLLMLKFIRSLASDFGSGIIFIESLEQDPMNIATRTTIRSLRVVLFFGVMVLSFGLFAHLFFNIFYSYWKSL